MAMALGRLYVGQLCLASGWPWTLTTPFSSVLLCSVYNRSRLHVSKHALLVSVAKFFNLACALPNLSLAAKFANLAAKLKLGRHHGKTRGKHTETKKVGSQTQTWQNSSKFKFGCQVWNMAWFPAKTEKLGRIKCHACGTVVTCHTICTVHNKSDLLLLSS